MSDYNLGTATGTIRFDYDGQTAALAAQRDLGAVEKSGMSSKAAWGSAARGLAIGGAVIAGGLALAVKSAASFEQGLSNIKAVSGATDAEMEKIRQTALRLGADTQYSAGEASSAMEELIKAGLSTKDVMNGAADATVNLAAAGEVDLTTAAGIAANAMNTFQLSAQQMPHVADLLAGAANASSTDVTALGEALKYAGPAASAAGISLDDTVTSMAAFAKYGIEGSMAGTSFRSMMLNLVPSSDAAASAMKQLGIITEDGTNKFIKANGDYKSMAQVSQVLKEATDGLAKSEKTKALNTIFGDRAMSSAIALSREGVKGFNELGVAMGNVTAEEVAKEKMDNLMGSLEQMKGSVETAAIVFGTALLPAIRAIVDVVTVVVNAFASMPAPVQAVIATVLTVIAILALLAAATIKIVLAINAFKVAWAAMNITFSISPIGIIIVAIIALVAILVVLYMKVDAVRNFIDAAWQGIQSAVTSVVNFLVPYLLAAWEAIKVAAQAAWSFIQSYIIPVLIAIWAGIQLYAKLWWNVIKTAFDIIVAVVKVAWATITNVIIPAMMAIWAFIAPILKLIWSIFKVVFTAIALVVKLGMAIIKGVIMGVMALLVPIIRAGWGIIKAIFQAAMHVIVPIVKTGWSILKSATQTVWGIIKSIIQAVWPPIKSAVSAGISFIMGVWHRIQALVSFVTGVFQRIVDAIQSKIDGASRAIENLPETIKNFFSDAGTWLLDAGKAIIQGLIDGIKSMIGAVGDAIGSVTDILPDWFPGSPAKKGRLAGHGGYEMRHRGQAMVEQLLEGIRDKQKLNREMNAFVNDINTHMLRPGSAMNNINVMPGKVVTAAPQIIQHVYGNHSDDALDKSARRLRDVIEAGAMR